MGARGTSAWDDGSDFPSHPSTAYHAALDRRRKPHSHRVLPKEVTRQAKPVKFEVVITTETPQSSRRFYHLGELNSRLRTHDHRKLDEIPLEENQTKFGWIQRNLKILIRLANTAQIAQIESN